MVTFLDASLQADQTDRFQEILAEVHGFPSKNDQQRAWSFFFGYHLELQFLINRKMYQQALELIPRVERGLSKHKSLVIPSVELTFFHNLMTTCFVHSEFSASLLWVYRILNHSAIKISPSLLVRSIGGLGWLAGKSRAIAGKD